MCGSICAQVITCELVGLVWGSGHGNGLEQGQPFSPRVNSKIFFFTNIMNKFIKGISNDRTNVMWNHNL